MNIRKENQNKIKYAMKTEKRKYLLNNFNDRGKILKRKQKEEKKYYMKKGEEIKAKDRERVECSFCGKELARGYLSRHTKKQHS